MIIIVDYLGNIYFFFMSLNKESIQGKTNKINKIILKIIDLYCQNINILTPLTSNPIKQDTLC